jgi:hypothetical protein
MAASNNGNLPNNFDDAEDKPMLLIKKPGDGPGISALINRQIQGIIQVAFTFCPPVILNLNHFKLKSRLFVRHIFAPK